MNADILYNNVNVTYDRSFFFKVTEMHIYGQVVIG